MDTARDVVFELNRFAISDTEIAKRVGASQPTIWRLRSGKAKDCSADLYRKLCLLRDQVKHESDESTPAQALTQEPVAPAPIQEAV